MDRFLIKRPRVDADVAINPTTGQQCANTECESSNTKPSPSPITTPNLRDPANGIAHVAPDSGPFQPEIAHVSTASEAGRQPRHFRKEWYSRHPWMEYSIQLQSVFCYYCRLYASHKPGCAEDAFTRTGVNNWKKVLERCQKHEMSKVHKMAFTFHQQRTRNPTTVAAQLSSAHKNEVLQNRRYMHIVIENILFLGKQGLSFRGHDESEESSNRGNFLELLRLRSTDCPIINQQSQSSVCKYTSSDSQNEFIEIIANRIRQEIIDDISVASAFAVIMDETQDIGRIEQVAICVRYTKVDDNGSVSVLERFCGFLDTPTTTGEALADLLLQELSRMCIPVDKLRAQSYDGASNMSGLFKGVAARVKAVESSAVYVHCHSHLLDLAVASVCKGLPILRNTMGAIASLYNHIEGSAKRHAIFKTVMQRSGCKNASLKSPCPTRWTQRYAAVSAVQEYLPQIVDTLNVISEDSTITGSEAHQLLRNILDFDFVFGVNALSRILAPCNILAKELQSAGLDIASVQRKACALIETFSSWRTAEKFAQIWEASVQLAENLPGETIPPQAPRRKQAAARFEGGGQATTFDVQGHYRVNAWFAAIDVVSVALSDRFSENDYSITNLLYKSLLERTATIAELAEISTFYKLPSEFHAQYDLFCHYSFEGDISNIFSMANAFQQEKLQGMLPLVWKLLETVLCIPVSTATAERSFSSLRRLKTYLRSTMGQRRLSGLALMNIESSTTEKLQSRIESIIDEFANRGNRRLLLG